jgi:PhnB protein
MYLNPYLSFDGNCGEAFAFYADVLGGKILMQMSYDQAPPDVGMEVPAGAEKRVMHIRMQLADSVLMGSDAPPGRGMAASGFHISLNMDDLAKAETVFARLSEGGQVMMALQKTFWARGFAMFTDRFGTPWMINCE